MEYKLQPLPPDRSVFLTLKYFHRYRYPLTAGEIYFWQQQSSFSRSQITSHCNSNPRIFRSGIYYSFSAFPDYSFLRRHRKVWSFPKLKLAKEVSRKLSRIPAVMAIFITGSLAMNSCRPDDDIDIMLVTAPDSLWITRFLIALYLKITGLRRPPHLAEHSSPRVADKICDNLYLDLNHLQINLPAGRQGKSTNLFLSHEILQAKCLFDRGGVHRQFLIANSWAADYLPVAYSQTLKQTSQLIHQPNNQSSNLIIATRNTPAVRPRDGASMIGRSPTERKDPGRQAVGTFIKLINYIFYKIQYLYMKPRLTSEKIGPGFAFFHPKTPDNMLLSSHG